MLVDEFFPGSSRTEDKFFTYNLLDCTSNELSINGLGLKERMKPCFNIREEGNKDWLILYFYDEVSISVNNVKYSDMKGFWVIISPGTPHRYGNMRNSWSHSWIHLSGEIVDEYFRGNILPINHYSTRDISRGFEIFLEALHREIYFNKNPIYKILTNQFENFILEVVRSLKLDLNLVPSNLERVKQYIDFRYKEQLPLEILSEIAGVTVPYLCLTFKKSFNFSPREYQLERRISIAKELLETTSYRIGEIAYKVGYDDVYYFSKSFKKRVGNSPSEYRRGFR